MERVKGKIEAWGNGDFITEIRLRTKGGYITVCCLTPCDTIEKQEEQDANAAHLVKCWNAFEDGGIVGELVEACEIGLQAIDMILELHQGYIDAMCDGFPDILRPPTLDRPPVDLIGRIIAKAKKEIA